MAALGKGKFENSPATAFPLGGLHIYKISVATTGPRSRPQMENVVFFQFNIYKYIYILNHLHFFHFEPEIVQFFSGQFCTRHFSSIFLFLLRNQRRRNSIVVAVSSWRSGKGRDRTRLAWTQTA